MTQKQTKKDKPFLAKQGKKMTGNLLVKEKNRFLKSNQRAFRCEGSCNVINSINTSKK